MLDRLRAVYALNPVRCNALLVAALLFLAAKLGLVIDEQNLGEALALALPVLLGGELARGRVSPDVGDVGVASDELLPAAALVPLDQ